MPARLPQTPPFRFVDRVLEIDPPRRCVTLKIFSAGEALPEGSGAVPASLMVEALCQSAAFLSGEAAPGRGRVVQIERAEITGEARAGDRLVTTTILLEEGAGAFKAESRAEVDGKQVARLTVLIQKE